MHAVSLLPIRRAITQGILVLTAIGGAARPVACMPAKRPTVSRPPARPAAAMVFTPSALGLAPGETYSVALFVPSPTGKAFAGEMRLTADAGLTVQPDTRWTGRGPAWGVKLYPKITAMADATGRAHVVAALTPGGSATLTVDVRRPAVKLIPGSHELRIQVTNPLPGRPLKGRLGVTNPDRFLGSVTSALVDIPSGATQEIKIPLPGAAPAEGETYSFTVTLQTWAGYHDQKTHPLKFPPQRPAAERVP